LRFKIISVGRERADPAAPLVKDYLSRIAKLVPVEDVVLRDERADRLAARIFKEAAGLPLWVALDERGKQYDSIAFSRKVASWMDQGMTGVAFIIGGADGLVPEVRDRAHALLALSKMTLPHRLARLVLAEQLYRACCIIRHVPYQK
jgi:23S rRNA (pseudouridine1915-N3)-methyltransferase